MKDLLNDAKLEILELRRENEILRAKVKTMDTLAAIFFTAPPSQGYGAKVDVAWELQKQIDALAADEKDKPANDSEVPAWQAA
jgi:hypothetical protein